MSAMTMVSVEDGTAENRRTPTPSLRGEVRGRPLSPREYECLRLYAWLGRWQDVADALGIGGQTVKNHVRGAYQKLDVGFATQAYMALGWLDVPGPRPTEPVEGLA